MKRSLSRHHPRRKLHTIVHSTRESTWDLTDPAGYSPFQELPRTLSLCMRTFSKTIFVAATFTVACGNTVHDAQIPAASPSASLASAPPPALSTSVLPLLQPDLTARNTPPTLRKTPFLGLTVSGGVSLGAYEAGFLYYLTEVAKLPENRSAMDLKLVTGASAGNINALFTILALCSKPQPNPQRSIFWDTWIHLGAKELFRPPSPQDPPETGHGAFARSALLRIAGNLESVFRGGIDEKCDHVLAVSTTRLKSAEVTLRDGFKVPRQEEKFVVRIRGRGPGRAPLVTNYVNPSSALPLPMLPFPVDQTSTDDQLKTFVLLRDLLLASAAFPVAFPPQPLPHCLTPGTLQVSTASTPVAAMPATTTPSSERRGVVTECKDLPVFTEDFIDGGVFDNSPLRLADSLAAHINTDGVWQDPGTPVPPGSRFQGGFLFIDPDIAAYPLPPETAVAPNLPLIPQIGSFLSNFISTARSKELYTLLQERPDIDVSLSHRHFPTASGHLANFFGFFEENFRRFDFYLGMYDAHRMALRSLPRVLDVSRPQTNEAVWDPFVCMSSVFSDEEHDQSACLPDSVRCAALSKEDCERKTRHANAFRVLLQISIDRLYSHCESLPPSVISTVDHHHCLYAAFHKPRRLVKGLPSSPPNAYRRRQNENDFEHTLRLLDLYQFHFEDLLGDKIIGRGGSVEAMTHVRYQLASLLERTARKQPSGDASMLRLLGKPALNFIYYAPPPTILYFSLGRGNEVGASWLQGWHGLRFTAAVQAKGIEEITFSDKGEAAFTPLIGAELEMYGSAIYQARLGFRAGYQMSTKGIRASDCRNPEATNSFSASRSDCSSFVVQLPFSLSIFERVRFQISPEYLVPHWPLDGKSWNILFGVGGQFISPFL